MSGMSPKSSIQKGVKVTFKDLTEPVMIVESIDWAINSAVCRYKDPIAKKNIHLTCDPNDLAPVNIPLLK
jgi:hypothetical protein